MKFNSEKPLSTLKAFRRNLHTSDHPKLGIYFALQRAMFAISGHSVVIEFLN